LRNRGFDPVAILFVGVIALVAGAGKLAQYPVGSAGVPGFIAIPIYLACVAVGGIIVGLAIRAVDTEHRLRDPRRVLFLGVGIAAVIVAFVAGRSALR
jgi:hypothetical protein